MVIARRRAAASGLQAMRRWIVLFCIFCVSLGSAAQAEPRDYVISPPDVEYTQDKAIVRFTVRNQGGDASAESEIVVAEYETGRFEVRQALPSLAAGAAEQFTIRLPLAQLPTEGTSFSFEAGIDEYELAGSRIARNNAQLLFINKPAAAAGSAPAASDNAPPAYDLFIPLVNLGINFQADGLQVNDTLYDSGTLLRGAGLLALALFCLWLLRLILLLVFRRPPKFRPWQPPYAVNNWYDPNSALGRRQSWQLHAQNSSISAPAAPDQVTVIKRLLDKDGLALGGWQIKAMRSIQYDIYGRISRSEALMPQKIIAQLNKIARDAPALEKAKLRQKVLPIAKRISKYAIAAGEKQNMILPIALDIRLEGASDTARVLFELYQYRSESWHLIDRWEPEMGQVGARLPEHFTFTLNGQYPGESSREFKARLYEDMAQLLLEMCHPPRLAEQADMPAAAPIDEGHEEAATTKEKNLPAADLLSPDDDTNAI